MLNGSSNLSARGVRGFQWVPLVKNVDRESFIQKTRGSGPDFINFSIRDRVNGSLVNASIQDDYYVILHAAPLSSSQELLGYNLISSEHEEREILLSRYAGVDTATSTFNLLENEKGFLYFSPVYTGLRNGDFVGLTCGVFHVVSLFSSFIDDHVVLFVYDKNVTDQQDETWMVHTTYTNGDVAGFSWPNPTVSNYLQVIRAAPYTVNRTVTIGDRKWEIVFFPKTKFIKERNGWEKYAALSISISVAVFTALVLSGVVKWLQYRDKLHRLNLQRVSILEENKKNLTEFLDRIAEQEEDSRNTMDCIPDHIVVLDDSGKIIKMNASFERAFNVTSIKFQQGITIDQYLTQLDHLFFTRGLIDQIETTIKKQTGLLVPVTVTVRPMGRYRFLVVIRNMAEKLTLIEQLQKQESEMKIMSGMMKFDQQIQDEEFRKRLLKYCQQEYNAENAEFIETIIQYKNSSVTQRMDLQEVIFNQYIAIGSPKQLNIEQELVTETAVKLSKSLGEANVFDSVLEKVKIMLCTDILPRFYQSNLHS
jgi:CHASE1-domain containing sensor protein